MEENEETYQSQRERLFGFVQNDQPEDDYVDEESSFVDEDDYDYDFDNSMNDVDFSQMSGRDFKRKLNKVNTKIGPTRFKGVIAPDNRKVIIEGVDRQEMFKPQSERPKTPVRKKRQEKISNRVVQKTANRGTNQRPPQISKKVDSVVRERRPNRPQPSIKKRPALTNDIPVRKGDYTLKGRRGKKVSDIIVPSDRPVIVKGASDFIVSQKNDQVKNVGYYKGKKLKELILIFNNNSAVDFEIEIFNPSMPLDYLYSTGQNLNDKVQVAGGTVSYTDVLFNLLANPTFIPNAKFVFSGPSITQQKSQALKIQNQNIAGIQKISPLNLDLSIDTMQVASDIVFFDMNQALNRPFIPDGMDIIKYKILAGMTITMAFFYEQVSLKKVFYKQADKPGIL
tara:strand:+ start:16317 stop:17504 length:1188 start_codon:yes stop_codon:yes gene_type:complete